MNKGNSYIGVSGFMSSDEVRAALTVFPHHGPQLMVGVLASYKTLFGPSNSKPRRYPRPEAIDWIFLDDPRCLNLVHYGADSSEGLGLALRKAMVCGGPRCHGVQINVAWPALDELRYFRSFFPSASRARGRRGDSHA
jgi:hypothetical protein